MNMPTGQPETIVVGSKVRVADGPGGRTCRGTVSYIDADAATYDVLVSDASGVASREINALTRSDLSALQAFELDGSLDSEAIRALLPEDTSAAAEALKDKGNVLFRLGDTQAAAEVFCEVLRALEPPPSVGAAVLVRSAATIVPVQYRGATVSDVDHGGADDRPSLDVIYDDDSEDGEDEENGVGTERVVTLSMSPCVSCAARLNLGRCYFKEARHPEVVDVCTLVIALARLSIADKTRPRDDRVKLRAHCLTAFRVRGGSHLAQNHIGLARKDARNMARLAGEDEEGRGQALRFEAEIDKRAKALLKANRKLAKDVTRWVDASMAKNEQLNTAQEVPASDDVEDAMRDAVQEQPGSSGGSGGVMSWLGWRR